MTGADELFGLFFAFHNGHKNGLSADVEHLFDQVGLSNRHAHNRVTVGGFQRDQLVAHRTDIVGRMLAIHNDPIKPGGAQHFGGIDV